MDEVKDKQELDRKIQELRELILKETNVHCRTDDAYLLRSLRAREYVVKDALMQIKKWEEARQNFPELFADLNPERLQHVFDENIQTVLKGRDKEGRHIIYFHCGHWDFDKIPMVDLYRANMLMVETLSWDEEVQKNGVVQIMDTSGVGWGYIRLMTPSYMRIQRSIDPNCMPFNLKGIYIVNEAPFMTFMMRVMSSIYPDYLMKKIKPLGRNHENLHQFVSPDVLPEEAGGTLGPLCNKDWVKDLKEVKL